MAKIINANHREMKLRKTKTEIVSFRIAASAHAVLHQRASSAGISTRAWLEIAILENRTRIVAEQKPHPELRPLLFQVSKAGNNINQLARHFNTLNLQQKITTSDFVFAMNMLEHIQAALLEAVTHAR